MKTSSTKNFSVILLSVVSLICISNAHAVAISIFTDQTAWETAVGSFSVETFDDTTLNPGLSVYSIGGGSVSGGVYNDVVYDDGDITAEDTIWSFATPIFAFGGNWDLSPYNPGSSLEITMHGSSDFFSPPGRPDIANTYTGEFWGIFSDTPFDTIQILSANIGVEHYSLDNFVYSKAKVPEPNSLLLLAIGLIGFTTLVKRNQSRTR